MQNLNCIPLYVCGPPKAVDSIESSNTFALKEAIDSIDAVEPTNTDPAKAVDSGESTETVERAETVDPVLQYSPAATPASSPRSTHLSPTNSARLPVEPNPKPRSPGDFIHGADSTANGNTAVKTVSKIPDAHGMHQQPSGQVSCYSRQASKPTFASVVVSGARPPAPSSLIKIAAVEKLLWNGLPPVGVKVSKGPSKSKSVPPKPYFDGDNGYWRGNLMIPSSQYCSTVNYLVEPLLSVDGRLQSVTHKPERQESGDTCMLLACMVYGIWYVWCMVYMVYSV
jgi:hypothetical protein